MSNQPESSDFKKDFNSAILERKKSPNRFVVDEAIDDDTSAISLHHSTMEKATAFPGDAILIKGKKRKDTVFILFSDESCEDPKIRMNKIVRSNLRVRLGDVILSSLLTNALTSNTESVCISCLLIILLKVLLETSLMLTYNFKVIETDPAEYCVVAPDTEILCEGLPITWEDEERLADVSYDDVGDVRKQMAQI
ncbi:hypothetical protein Bca101_035776 [Brassica carinata]